MEKAQEICSVYEVKVPEVGSSTTQWRIEKWHVEDRVEVRQGEILATLTNDTISQKVEAEMFGEITRLFPELTMVNAGKPIATIASSGEEVTQSEKKEIKEVKEADPVSESTDSSHKKDTSTALFKLIILVLLVLGVTRYGVPLVNQISEKAGQILNKENTEQSSSEPKEEVTSEPQVATARVTKGYEAWEPAVCAQLEEWHVAALQNGSKYKLTNIDVNDERSVMEVRYRLIEADGVTSKRKITLAKDGFGSRFIYTEGAKEFLVYPPE